jgi:prophage DNA circulation protein
MDDVSRAIGALEASVRDIKEGQATVTATVKEVEKHIHTVKSDVVIIKTALAEIGPAAKKINNWEQRMLGIGGIMAFAGGFATLLLTKLRDYIIG